MDFKNILLIATGICFAFLGNWCLKFWRQSENSRAQENINKTTKEKQIDEVILGSNSEIDVVRDDVKFSKEIVASLFEAKKAIDLEKFGSPTDICNALNNVFQYINASADTYEKIFEILESFRLLVRNLGSYPFISRQDEVLFSLTELDGKKRLDRLGVTDEMYNDMDIAKKWYKSISQLVHPDKIGGDNSLPFQNLKKIYEKITHEPAPEL